MLKLMKIALLAAMTVADVLLFTAAAAKVLSIDEMLSSPSCTMNI
jgi:hypothetical protein